MPATSLTCAPSGCSTIWTNSTSDPTSQKRANGAYLVRTLVASTGSSSPLPSSHETRRSTMTVAAHPRFGALIKEDAVHRRVYTDPEIFAEEMRRIFGRTWVFIGHESEIPNAGDFKTDEIAGQPIIMVRDVDGGVRVLFNRCMHRGAVVCELVSGNTTH